LILCLTARCFHLVSSDSAVRSTPLSQTVIDGGELIQALSDPCDPLEELHVQLQAMPRPWLRVSLPGSASLRAVRLLLANAKANIWRITGIQTRQHQPVAIRADTTC